MVVELNREGADTSAARLSPHNYHHHHQQQQQSTHTDLETPRWGGPEMRRGRERSSSSSSNRGACDARAQLLGVGSGGGRAVDGGRYEPDRSLSVLAKGCGGPPSSIIDRLGRRRLLLMLPNSGQRRDKGHLPSS
ncbi:hypothetical protein C0Q70_20171 [Pomacea canaliculata]|uniref:Uncharacterized protein n=1 Tax=Pomacea canaliculata TaxID=400727 RepID=A0A2T7NEU6_POMCA|nr:hypothetical protein C0Q70_20171 [Pomacea canaliculata]